MRVENVILTDSSFSEGKNVIVLVHGREGVRLAAVAFRFLFSLVYVVYLLDVD